MDVSRHDLSEFNPDPSRAGLVGIRIQLKQHGTQRTGLSKWRDCLELDVADSDSKTGLDLEAMVKEAYREASLERRT